MVEQLLAQRGAVVIGTLDDNVLLILDSLPNVAAQVRDEVVRRAAQHVISGKAEIESAINNEIEAANNR